MVKLRIKTDLDFYILDPDGTTRHADIHAWAEWAAHHERQVALSDLGDIFVSTVFIGHDMSLLEGPPLLFETMIFGGPRDRDQRRYSTRAEAEAGHAAIVAELQRTPQ